VGGAHCQPAHTLEFQIKSKLGLDLSSLLNWRVRDLRRNNFGRRPIGERRIRELDHERPSRGREKLSIKRTIIGALRCIGYIQTVDAGSVRDVRAVAPKASEELRTDGLGHAKRSVRQVLNRVTPAMSTCVTKNPIASVPINH
jgi:hypothetical protein